MIDLTFQRFFNRIHTIIDAVVDVLEDVLQSAAVDVGNGDHRVF